MTAQRKALSAQDRLEDLLRSRKRLARERMLREVAGPRWKRMIRVTPVLFGRTGELHVHLLTAGRDRVIEALRDDGIFALDSALRVRAGYGFLSSGDVQVYLPTADALQSLTTQGLIATGHYLDATLVRPLGGPPRLLASVASSPPPFDLLPSGYRVVTRERLERELIGAVGPRADLFALVELEERRPTAGS